MKRTTPLTWCIHRAILPLCIVFVLFTAFNIVAFTPAPSEASSVHQHEDGKNIQRDLHIIRLQAEPVATYSGGVPGYAATSPRLTGATRLDLNSAAVEAYRTYLRTMRENALAQMAQEIGRHLMPVHTYELTFNGFAVRLSATEAAHLDRVNGVQSVTRETQQQLQRSSEQLMLSQDAILNLIQQQGGKVIYSSWPALRVLAFGLFTLALYEGLRRRRRTPLWLLAGVTLLITTACGSDGGSTLRIEWPGAADTAPGVALIRAPQVWFGTGSASIGRGTMGEGIVVGVIDTGISPHSPSFAETGADGYTHENPRGRLYGVCDPNNPEMYNSNFKCNNKLIGAWALAEDNYNPVDFNGHGSHVAATAAGNFVENATIHAPSGMSLVTQISGVAPRANIIAYNVAKADGTPSTAAILAAIEQAIKDEVDVLNYSMGSPTPMNPWAGDNSSDINAFLGAREAGVWVANAAGNDGPASATLGTPSSAPWLNVVASSTHDVVLQNKVTLSGSVEGLEELIGLGLSAGYGPAPLIYAGDYGDPRCTGKFNAAFNGEIVICDRGEVARVDKGKYVKENGAGGMIHAEVEEGDATALVMDIHTLPATHISQPDADRLKGWLHECQAKGEELQATLSGTIALSDPHAVDIISDFSSRGFNSAAPSIVKPDMTAPGSSIFAPVVDGLGYAIDSGTSMASPHVAGALALLKAQHPNWTPAQAQSALMTTSFTDVRRNSEGDPATPFDMGAGRIDVANAINAALVLDESGTGYRNANPELYWGGTDPDKGDPASLNLASLGDGFCIERCEWTRTVTNVSSQSTSWEAELSADPGLKLEVEPNNFTLAPGQSLTLRVYADSSAISQNEWSFGRVSLRERNNVAPGAHLPVAVRNMAYNLPESWEINTSDLHGVQKLYRLETVGATAVTSNGWHVATLVEESVAGDPTPRYFDNNDGGVYFHSIEIPAGATALLIDLNSDEATDLDLYAGLDEFFPDYIGVGGVIGPREQISIPTPDAGAWWIAVHNKGGGFDPDGFTLQYAIVGGDASPEAEEFTGSLEVTPHNIQEPSFTLDVAWKVTQLLPEKYLYGTIDVFISPHNQRVIIPLRLANTTTANVASEVDTL